MHAWLTTVADRPLPIPHAVPAEPSSVRKPRRWIWLSVVLVVLLVASGGAGVATQRADEQDAYPDEWAAPVRPYVDIVEDERDLAFKHPVEVEFLSDEDFRREITADEAELTDKDREEIEQVTGLLRAFGLIEGELDLFEAANDLRGEGVIGYYSYDDEIIRIRGTTLTPTSTTTLVHELTHALQDQHFDLGKRQKELENDKDSAGGTAFDALVEGDARRIETAYRDGLSDEERAELDEEQASEWDEYEGDVADIPGILKMFSQAPYTLGEAMLRLVVAIDGNDAVDALFREPPTTEEHLIDPWTLLEDEDTALEVGAPRLRAGEEKFDAGELGAMTWYVLLAERIPVVDALDAVDGWGGDAYLAFERDGLTCVRINHESDTAVDRQQMHDALQTWDAALPGAPASVERDGAVITFESCDPGTGTDVGTDSSDDAVQLALVRTYLAADIYDGSGQQELSRCFADKVIHEFTLKQLAGPTIATDPEMQQKIGRLGRSCL